MVSCRRHTLSVASIHFHVSVLLVCTPLTLHHSSTSCTLHLHPTPRSQIEDLSPLQALQGLKSLTLTQNRVRLLAPLSALASLETLKLQGNDITNIDELRGLQDLSKLRRLELRDADASNPACDHPAYVKVVIGYVPQVVSLDGQRYDLGEGLQSAVLQSVDTPDEKLELPPSVPWLQPSDLAEMEGGLPLFEDDFVDSTAKDVTEYFAGTAKGREWWQTRMCNAGRCAFYSSEQRRWCKDRFVRASD